MGFRIKSPWWMVRLLVIGGIFVGLGWLGHRAWRSLQAERASLAWARQERERLHNLARHAQAQRPAAIETEVREAEQQVAALQLGSPADGGSTESPVEAFIAIESFVRSARERAERRKVRLRSGERFGFEAYARSGPEPTEVSSVRRQREALQVIVEALLESGPDAVGSVRRGTGDAAGVGGSDSGAAGKIVAWGEVRDSFHLTFDGGTENLREFLSRLALASLPLVVRRLEVAPVAGGEEEGQGSAPIRDGGIRVVAEPQRMSFAVWIDWVEPRR